MGFGQNHLLTIDTPSTHYWLNAGLLQVRGFQMYDPLTVLAAVPSIRKQLFTNPSLDIAHYWCNTGQLSAHYSLSSLPVHYRCVVC